MRKIKFRAWDGNRMWFSGQEGEEDENGNTFQLYYHGDYGTYKASLLGPQFLVATDPYPMYHPGEEAECKLMQYTGIRDMNGKEIYEGDIIFHHHREEEYRLQGVVRYEEQWAGFYFAENRGMNTNTKYEVLGNIYENPDLITP